MLLISVEPGEEVITSITRQLESAGIRNGAIASLIGAIDECGISNMDKGNAQRDIISELSQPYEISGTGEVKDGKPHIHCVVSGEGNASMGGHLHWAKVESFFVNAYILPL